MKVKNKLSQNTSYNVGYKKVPSFFLFKFLFILQDCQNLDGVSTQDSSFLHTP